jgi:hypothetical protein
MKTIYQQFCQELFTRIWYGEFMHDTFHENERGQTLVEFILLLAVISGLSFIFLKVINNNLSVYWAFFVTKIVDDPSANLRL